MRVLLLILLLCSLAWATPEWRPAGPRPGDPEVTTQALTIDLSHYNLVELALLRNGIFARHGHPFRTPFVKEYFESQKWYKSTHVVPSKELSEVELANLKLIHEAEDAWTPDRLKPYSEQLQKWMDEEMSKENSDEAKVNDASTELAIINERLRLKPVVDAIAGQKRLSLAMLKDQSLDELLFERNSIFARRGYSFKDPIIRQHFQDQGWYRPDPNYSEKLLTDVDKYNARLILQVEKDQGGPLKDQVGRRFGGA